MDKVLSNSDIYQNIRQLIEQSRRKVVSAVNFAMIETYWHIGSVIVQEEQQGRERAVFGDKLIPKLAVQLTQEFGKGFNQASLWRMRQFYQTFPILAAVRRELTWTHYRLLMQVSNEQARAFYLEEAVENQWSTRQLDRQINSFYFELLLASQNKSLVRGVANQNGPTVRTEDILKDPTVLEFLGLWEHESKKTKRESFGEKFPDFEVETTKKTEINEIMESIKDLKMLRGEIGDPVKPLPINTERLLSTLEFLKNHDTYYTKIDYRTFEITWYLGLQNALGWREKDCSIHNMLTIIHPDYLGPYLFFAISAYTVAFKQTDKNAWGKSLKSRYIINYPVKKSSGRYVWIKQMSLPFTFDSSERAVEQLNSYTIVCRFEGAILPIAPRLYGDNGKRNRELEKKICHLFLESSGLDQISPDQLELIKAYIRSDSKLTSKVRDKRIKESPQRIPISYKDVVEEISPSIAVGAAQARGKRLQELVTSKLGFPFKNIYEVSLFLRTLYIEDWAPKKL